MKRNLSFLLSLLFLIAFSQNSFAQDQLWSQPISKGVVMTQLENGNILTVEKDVYTLFDLKSGEQLWTKTMADKLKHRMLTDLPIMALDGKQFQLIDATNGDVLSLIDRKAKIIETHYFRKRGRVILEVQDKKKMISLVTLNLEDPKSTWTTEVGEFKKGMLSLGAEKKRVRLSDNGTISFTGKKYLTVLSPEGTLVHKEAFKDKVDILAYSESLGITYLKQKKKTIAAYSTETGKLIASYESEKDIKKCYIIDGGKSLVLPIDKEVKFIDGQTMQETKSMAFEKPLKGVYAVNETEYLFFSGKELSLINGASKEVVKNMKTEKSFDKVFTLDDQWFVSFGRKTNQFDPQTMEYLYKEHIPVAGAHLKILMRNGQDLFVHHTAKSSEFKAIDQNGEVQWKKSISYVNRKPSIIIADVGLVVIDEKRVDLISHEDGKSFWKKNIKADASTCYEFFDGGNKLCLFTAKWITIVDLVTGEKSYDKAIKFKDFNYDSQQPQIIVGDQIFVKGSNSVFLLDLKGKVIEEAHFARTSNTSSLLTLANAAVEIGTIASGNAGKLVTVTDGSGQEIHKGSMVDDMSNAYEFADDVEARRRREQNRGSANYPFVYTKKDKEKGLLFLDASTIADRFFIPMNNKSGNYIIDELEGHAIIENNEKIEVYKIGY